MGIKIDSKKLKDYVEKATLKGMIKEFVIEFTNDGLVVNCKTPDGVNAVLSQLKREVFTEYDLTEGKFGIKDSSKLVSILNTFDGNVNIDINENLLTIYDKNKSASLVLAKPEFLTDTVISQVPEAFDKFDNGVKINSSIFTNTVKNMGIIGSDLIKLNVKDNKLNIKVGDENFDKIEETIDCEYKDVKATYQNSLKIVVPCISDTVNMSLLDNDAPIQLTSKTEDYTIRFIAGPASVDEEETAEKEEE